MKKIQDLKPNEAIEIRTKKEAKKILKLKGLINVPPFYVTYDEVKLISTDIPSHVTLVYHANDFLPKKKKWKKEAFIEIARLDSEVNELRHMLAKDMPVNVGEIVSINEPVRFTEKVIPDPGKWYNVSYEHNDELFGLIYVTEIKGVEVHHYGFHFDRTNIWTDKDWIVINLKYTHATPEEVKSALIKEAERRGYKKGCKVDRTGVTEDVDYICVITNECEKWLYHAPEDSLELYGFIIYEKGKWAEILEQPKYIDWNKEGQLVQDKDKTLIIITSGIHTTYDCFGGVVMVYNKNTHSYSRGHYSEDWYCKDFKPYTGEPIILKP